MKVGGRRERQGGREEGNQMMLVLFIYLFPSLATVCAMLAADSVALSPQPADVPLPLTDVAS